MCSYVSESTASRFCLGEFTFKTAGEYSEVSHAGPIPVLRAKVTGCCSSPSGVLQRHTNRGAGVRFCHRDSQDHPSRSTRREVWRGGRRRLCHCPIKALNALNPCDSFKMSVGEIQ